MSHLVIALLLSLVFATVASARSPFVLDATVENTRRSFGFHDILDAVDTLQNAQLERLFSNYTEQSPVNIRLDLRGLPVRLQYGQGETTLNLVVPSCGINRAFRGNTRDDSSHAFERYLKQEGGSELTCLLQKLAQTSPIDPVTGVAGSLFQTMTIADSGLGSNVSSTSADAKIANQFSVLLRFGRYAAHGFDSTVLSLPLGYTWNLSNGLGLAVDFPVTYSETDGAKAYNASLGLGVRLPLSRFLLANPERWEWDITPIVRFGAAGSPELASLGLVYALGVKSDVTLHLTPAWHIDLQNLVSRYKTIPIHAGDLHIDYALENVLFRNGLSMSIMLPGRLTFWPLVNKKLSIKGSFTDTRFTGNEIFGKAYDDVAIDFGTVSQEGGATWENARIGFQYTFSNDFHGFAFNLGYTF